MKRKNRLQLNRSGKIECECCGDPHYLQQHHIRGREIENANHPSNLANICANCHEKVHRGDIIIEDRLMSTDGYVLIWHYKEDGSFTGNDAEPYIK